MFKRFARTSLGAGLIAGTTALAAITERGTGIILGSNHAFSLTAPEGWVLDNESAVQQGVHALFYPKGSTWKDSIVAAYARARPKTDRIDTADAAAEEVIKDFVANGNPNYTGKRVKSVKTASGKEAVIYHFWGDQWGNSEAAAYVVESKTINFVTLTARQPAEFKKALPAFEQLVASYEFVGDGPERTTKNLSTQFEELRSTANRLSETAEGKEYENQFGKAFISSAAPALKKCTGKTKTGESLRLVFVVAADGQVIQIVPAPNQPESACIAKNMGNFTGPPPPKPNWSVAVRVHVQ